MTGGLFIFDNNLSNFFVVLSSIATTFAAVVAVFSLWHLKTESRARLNYVLNEESLRLLLSIIYCFSQIQVLAKSDSDQKSKIKDFEDQFIRDFELLMVTRSDDNCALSPQDLSDWRYKKINGDSIDRFLMCARSSKVSQGFDGLLNEKNRKLKGFYSALLKSF
jgi:hypothetical protein